MRPQAKSQSWVRKGYRVAICEQAEPAEKGVKLVKREVVRVITRNCD
jgi:DNA mismatch repair ATPase MutS